MKHGHIPLLIWWIMLLNPEPSPESSRILSNIVIGESIKIHHATQLLYPFSLLFIFWYFFIKFTSKPEESQNFTSFWPEKRSEKNWFVGPKNVRKTWYTGQNFMFSDWGPWRSFKVLYLCGTIEVQFLIPTFTIRVTNSHLKYCKMSAFTRFFPSICKNCRHLGKYQNFCRKKYKFGEIEG